MSSVDPPMDVDSAAPPTRTIPVGGAVENETPTTAQLIDRTDASIARPLYAGLGVALHHFTELLVGSLNANDLHRATTVLTKQVHALLDHDDALEEIHRLVIDPARIAMPDGRQASEICGDEWPKVCDVATRRSEASLEGAEEFGQEAIVNLAVVRGVGAEEPWWGTPMWKRRAELVPGAVLGPESRTRLTNAPELVGDELLRYTLELAQPEAISDDAVDATAQRRPRSGDPDVTSEEATTAQQRLGAGQR